MLRCIVIVLAIAASPAQAKTVAGSVTFTAHAKPPALPAWDIAGKGGKVEGILDDAGKGALSIKMADLTTDMDGRDSHMREYLQVATYPDAKLELLSVSVTAGQFTGKLTLHGVTKPVSGKAAISGTHAKCEFTVKLSDYGLPQLSKMGITVQDDVAVVAEVDAK